MISQSVKVALAVKEQNYFTKLTFANMQYNNLKLRVKKIKILMNVRVRDFRIISERNVDTLYIILGSV